MQNKKIKVLVFLLTLVLVLSVSLGIFAGCVKDPDEVPPVKIGVMFYSVAGAGTVSTKAYLDSLKDELNVDFQYAEASSNDDAKNKTVAQNLISSGCKGIITTVDAGTEAILAECKKAGVYLAGYINDFNNTYDDMTASGNANGEYFLGTAVDGDYNGTADGIDRANQVIASGCKNVGLVMFPSFAYPKYVQSVASFKATIDTYNSTAAAADKITYQAEPTTLMFSKLTPAYFSENPDIDAIVAFCAGTQFVYPVMVENNKTNIKLFTSAYDASDDIYSNFGTKGNGCVQRLDFTASETVLYPLILMLNKINGTEFSDMPAKAERVDCPKVTIASNADLDLVKNNSIYSERPNLANSLITPAQAKALLAANGGTYAKLKATVTSMDISSLR